MSFPEPLQFNGMDLRPWPSVDEEAERDREQRWSDLEADMRDFAAREPDGWSAVARCLATAMKTQRELLR